ncbi:type I-E CRISPR-associated protein Cse1/CasA [Longispora sp. NPDC051575]|uniref:type I-E CRISPR-associated protein Cse1/CasA n=1 Tax=Longispora sp. NPDC051575 TaxID=3154943 RepID=UPI00341A7D22
MTFSLWHQPWLPVRRDGRIEHIGLASLFRHAHLIEDLAVPQPPAAEGVLRILLAITVRVAGLDRLSDEDWPEERLDLLEAGSFDNDAINAYASTHASASADRFDLFHPQQPFLQDPRLAEQCPKSSGINKMMIARASGNNQPWFDGHHRDADPVAVPPAEAALALIAQYFYGPSGRCTSRQVGAVKEANTMAGPLRTTIAYHPVGRNLFQTLLVGLAAPSPWASGEEDLCPWERDDLPDPLAVPRPVAGYRSMLTARAHHSLLLVPDAEHESVVDAYLTWGTRARNLPVEDPYLIIQVAKDGNLYTRQADASRALFRDVDALLLQTRPTSTARQPLIFHNCAEHLSKEFSRGLRVRAYGFDQDGQTRDKQWFSAITPPVLGLLEHHDPVAAVGVRVLREAAELAASRLGFALKQAWRAYSSPSGGGPAGKVPDGPWPARAAADYWALAEQEFWTSVRDADFDAPARRFVLLALGVYDGVTATTRAQPRGARACEGARGLLISVMTKEAA